MTGSKLFDNTVAGVKAVVEFAGVPARAWDHLFYDRLQSSPDPSVVTSLRFDALAAADANADGEVTLEELNATPIDVRLYDPSGLGAATYGAFVTQLARTVGHFRGEGECTVSRL